MRRAHQGGLTLIEVLLAVTLVALLSSGMLYALRAGLTAMEAAERRIGSLRRAAGAQRILRQQIAGFLPVMARCGGSPVQEGGPPVMFFQGLPGVARFVTRYSIQGGARGRPQVVELFVAPRPEGGVRLLVNEIPYTGPAGAGFLCAPPAPDPATGGFLPVFPAPQPGPGSFVLADRLAACRFLYLEDDGLSPARWVEAWRRPDLWPSAIRVEMAPLDPASATAATVTALIRQSRLPGEQYEP
ncbi:MAG: prepilin-type N-terminal cleavage/methylation domain-containing protein [Bryobacteraceae bacterium]